MIIDKKPLELLTKYCPHCKEIKSIDNFSKNKSTSDGAMAYCKKCAYQYAKKKEYDKKYRKLYPERYVKYREKCYKKTMTPDRRFNYKLKNTYNMTREEFDMLFIKQKGTCKLCNKPIIKGKNLYIDHNHKTNKVRGLLCGKCNIGLGHFYEDVKVLKKAIRYIEKNGND